MGSIILSEIKNERTRSQILAQLKANRVPSGAVVESGDQNVAVAQDEGKGSNAVRCFARVTFRCFRMRSLDDENACTKFFTDALRFADAIFDDSKKWARIVVKEEIVTTPEEERTEIDIDYVEARPNSQ